MPRTSRAFSAWAGVEVQRRGFSEHAADLSKVRYETEEATSDEANLVALPAPGTGEMYIVVFQSRVPVRERPEQDAPIMDVLTPNKRVELFAWSGNFRQVVRGLAKNKGAPTMGWVLLSSASHGPLLEKLPESHQSFSRETEDPANDERGWLSYKSRKELDLGEQPLAMAARKRCVKKVINLLWRGYDPNGQDMLGETPLFEVVGSEAHQLVAILLLARANPNHEAKSGLTPLEMAEGCKHRCLLEYFAARRNNAVPLRLSSRDELYDVLQDLPDDLAEAAQRHLGLLGADEAQSSSPAQPCRTTMMPEPKATPARRAPQHFDLTAGEDKEGFRSAFKQARDQLDARSSGRQTTSDRDQVCNSCGKTCSADFRFCAFCGNDFSKQQLAAQEQASPSHEIPKDEPPPSTQEPPPPRSSNVAIALPESQDGETFRVVFKGRVAVRMKPSTDGEVISVLKPGEEVTLLKQEDADDASEWRRTKVFTCTSKKEMVGWVRIMSPTHGMLLEKVLPPEDQEMPLRHYFAG